jgi:hypothetical protein
MLLTRHRAMHVHTLCDEFIYIYKLLDQYLQLSRKLNKYVLILFENFFFESESTES